MKRQQPSIKLLKALFAKSGNRCAFTGCHQPLIDENNLFVGQLCHIEAFSQRGPRFNPENSTNDLNDYDNFVLMCYAHHKRIDDDPVTYSVESIRKMKADHEARFKGSEYVVSDDTVRKILAEIDEYWTGVKQAQLSEHEYPDFAVPFDEKADFDTALQGLYGILLSLQRLCELLSNSDERLDDDLRSLLERLHYDISAYNELPYNENPFVNRNWELRVLGIHNHFVRIQILVKQLELKHIEERLKTNPNDKKLAKRYDSLKVEFEKLVVELMLND